MSTFEKAVELLQEMPEPELEAVYMYIRFVSSQIDPNEFVTDKEADSMEQRKKGFEGLMSFAGTLPEDFDYKRELEEAREAKYARFI